MNDTKEKKISGRIIISAMVLTVILIAELYLMINHAKVFLIPIIILGVVALVVVYILIQAIIALMAEKEAQRQAHYANIYRSEKASYILLKNKFEELEGKLAIIQETSKIPSEEIINAQKGIAKVIINRSKENADAIINSNDQVLDRLDEIDETQNNKFTGISKDQRLKLTEMSNQTELKLQDMVVQLKDMELRLNQAIMQNSAKVVVEAGQPVFHEEVVLEEPVIPEEQVFEEEYDPNKPMSPEDIAALLASMGEGSTEAEEPVSTEEELIAEDPIIPEEELIAEDPIIPEEPIVVEEEYDPNKSMSPEDIAALLASMDEGSAEVEEPVSAEEELMVEEPIIPEEPSIPEEEYDPNKPMSADDIAALFASMSGGEEVIEEPEVEDVPPMPDLSDPNRSLSPDEIAALIANL